MEPILNQIPIKIEPTHSVNQYISPICKRVADIAINLFHSMTASLLTYVTLKFALNASILISNGSAIFIGLIALAILSYLNPIKIEKKPLVIPVPIKTHVDLPKVNDESDKPISKLVEFVPTPQNIVVQPSPKLDDSSSDNSSDTEIITPLSGSVYDILDPQPIEVNMVLPKIPSPSTEKPSIWWSYVGYGTLWGSTSK